MNDKLFKSEFAKGLGRPIITLIQNQTQGYSNLIYDVICNDVSVNVQDSGTRSLYFYNALNIIKATKDFEPYFHKK